MNSVTKTFQKEFDVGELMDWFMKQIETEDVEIPYPGAEPSLDVQTRLKEKIQITIKVLK